MSLAFVGTFLAGMVAGVYGLLAFMRWLDRNI